MVCPNCGAHNNDTTTSCSSCGFVLNNSVAAPPIQQSAPLKRDSPLALSVNPNPYITEYIMGLIGSMLGVVLFIVLLLVGIFESLNINSVSFGILTIYASILTFISCLFILVSFILGFIGARQVNKGRVSGGVLLVIGGVLGFVATLFGLTGWIAMSFFPMLLAAGIMALIRRKSVERDKHKGD
jgi:hypothetical protein